MTSPSMNAVDALAWCRRHNATIRFETDGTVTVEAFGRARRAFTLGDALTALNDDWYRMPANLPSCRASIQREYARRARALRTNRPVATK